MKFQMVIVESTDQAEIGKCGLCFEAASSDLATGACLAYMSLHRTYFPLDSVRLVHWKPLPDDAVAAWAFDENVGFVELPLDG